MTTTWSPQSTCGVKLGLCLPRRMLAMIVASRPTTSPSASTRCHFFSTSRGLADLVVFISAFMARTSCETKRAALQRSGAGGGQMTIKALEVKQISAFGERYYNTLASLGLELHDSSHDCTALWIVQWMMDAVEHRHLCEVERADP